MNWATIQAGLLAWFAGALGVDDEGNAIPCQWSDEPHDFVAFGLQGLVKVRSVVPVGRDELRHVYFADGVPVVMTTHTVDDDEEYAPGVYTPPGIVVTHEPGTVFFCDSGVEGMIPTVVGSRRVTVSFVVEAHHLTPSWSAHRFLERAAGKLRLPATAAALDAVGLGLLGFETIQVVDGEVDGRKLGRATLDVHFSALSCVADADNPASWIETVGLTTHYQDPAGVELPTPPNLLDETVPA